MAAPPRTAEERRADTNLKLEAQGADVWVATASSSGVEHLVPLSYAWDGDAIILAAMPTSPTVRNVQAAGRARLGFGPTRDVVLVDATLDRVTAATDALPATADRYAEQSGWDPRRESDPYVFVFLRPRRIQAWREANELDGKTIMRDGVWRV